MTFSYLYESAGLVRYTKTTLLLMLGLLVAVAGAVSAGSQENPELVDPSGDHEVTAGPLVLQPDSFDDIDIVSAWFEQRPDAPGGQVWLNILTEGEGNGGAIEVDLTLLPTGSSQFGSLAAGQSVTIAPNTTLSGQVTSFEIAYDLLTAGGGDAILLDEIRTTRTDTGTVEQLEQDDQTGTDTANNATAFILKRPPVVADFSAQVVSATAPNGSELTGTSWSFDEGEAGEINVVLQVTNDGTDIDAFTVQYQQSPDSLLLAPGDSGEVALAIPLPADAGFLTIAISSTKGVDSSLEFAIEFIGEAPEPTQKRTPIPAGITWMTPLTEALGFDHLFGDVAELVLLGLLLLILILGLFLLMNLRRAPDEVPAQTEKRGDVLAAGARNLGLVQPKDRREMDEALASLVGERTDAIPTPIASEPTHTGSRLRAVVHEPQMPRPGDNVLTTATVANPERNPIRVRVTVKVDDVPLKDELVSLGPGQSKQVRLDWTARDGPNRIKVQVGDEL